MDNQNIDPANSMGTVWINEDGTAGAKVKLAVGERSYRLKGTFDAQTRTVTCDNGQIAITVVIPTQKPAKGPLTQTTPVNLAGEVVGETLAVWMPKSESGKAFGLSVGGESKPTIDVNSLF